MRNVSLQEALASRDVLVLATDVYNDNNLIAKKNTPVTESIIGALSNLGIIMITVYEDGESFEPVKPPSDEEIEKIIAEPVDYKLGDVKREDFDKYMSESKYKDIYNAGIDALRHCDVDTAVDVSKELYETISSSESILSELEELKQGCDTVISHSMNVATMAIAVGLAMGMNKEEVEILGAGGMLHDVGKLYIDKRILDKPGKLTESEYAVMKSHARIGSAKLSHNRGIDHKIKLIAMQHHENNDGTGYPKGVRNKDILIESRIIHVCDVYEAMVAKRCYKEPLLPGLVMEYVMSKCGTMFDKKILEVFVHTIPAYKTNDRVVLSSGESGVVIKTTQNNSLRPVIKLDGTGEVIDLYYDRNSLNKTITGMPDTLANEISIRT